MHYQENVPFVAQHLAGLHQAPDNSGRQCGPRSAAAPAAAGGPSHQRRLYPSGVRGQSSQPHPGQWGGQHGWQCGAPVPAWDSADANHVLHVGNVSVPGGHASRATQT